MTEQKQYWKAIFKATYGNTAIDIRKFKDSEEANEWFDGEKFFFNHDEIISIEQVDEETYHDFLRRKYSSIQFSHAESYYTLKELGYE